MCISFGFYGMHLPFDESIWNMLMAVPQALNSSATKQYRSLSVCRVQVTQ